MAPAAHTLPLWILLVFSVLLIGIITLIYTRGNWRTTLLLVGLSLIVVLGISGIEVFNDYLKNHFIGQFDQLGIPFRAAGPGWSLLPAAWPLWLIPTGIAAVLAFGINYIVSVYFPSALAPFVEQPVKPSAEPPPLPAREPIPMTVFTPTQNVARKLEWESLKQDLANTKEKLASAIEIAEEYIDKNQDLEIAMEQLKEETEEDILDFEEKINALTLEISSRETANKALIHQISQLEERLK